MSLILLLAVIFFSSLILTMVGLGGGLIFSPLFVLLGFPLTTAVSASLFLNGIAALSAAITYYRKKMIDVKTAVPLLVSSSLAAPFGAMLTRAIDLRVFSGIMAGVIFLAAMRMIFSGKAERASTALNQKHRILGGGAIGIAVGVMAGLLGICGGIFIVPLLIYVLKMPTKTAAATSIFIVVFSSFSGFVAHISLASTDWKFILLAAVFSFAGGQLGSRVMSEQLKGKAVRRIFGVILLIFFLKLLQRTWL
jgi:uncharacterized membrane protein YfcA